LENAVNKGVGSRLFGECKELWTVSRR